MGRFFSSLFSEFGERRVRLRTGFGDRTASIVEFLFLGGIVLGCLAAALGEWRGLGALVGLIVGYVALDISRQRALAAGVDEEVTRKRQDRLVFVLFAAMALMGAALLFYQQQESSRQLEPPDPGEEFNVDIGPPS